MIYILKHRQGGVLIYTEDKLDQIKGSLVKFQEKPDTKAAMGLNFAYASGEVWSIMPTSLLARIDASDGTDHTYYFHVL